MTHFEAFQSQSIRLLFFVNNKPDYTITLFTLRVYDKEYSVILDMNMVNEEKIKLEEIQKEDIDSGDMIFECYSESDFLLKANYLSTITFEKMVKKLKEYVTSENRENLKNA